MTDTWISQLTESQFQEMIVERAKARGWLVHHDRGDYRRCIAGNPGFPDLVVAKAGAVLFIEVKTETGRVSKAQDAWLTAIHPHYDWKHHFPDELPVYVWRPSDWPQIQRILDQEIDP